jgi:four helix bundle protein
LGDLEIYRLSLELSDRAWKIYRALPQEFRFSLGDQLLRSADSAGANIAEGYGRFHYRDSIKFYYNARGSLWEVKHWMLLAYRREFIGQDHFDRVIEDLDELGRKINGFIQYIKNK